MSHNLLEDNSNLLHPYSRQRPGKDAFDWETDGLDWPNREHSQFVNAAGLRWHVQVMGHGPQILLLHGTGSSTHSWRDFAPLLAAEFTVIAPDLPGHAFTESPSPEELSLQGMSDAVSALIKEMDICPCIVVGHSAGAAILARMALDKVISPRWLVSLNGALLPLGGFSGILFSPLARLFTLTEFGTRLFNWRATDKQVVKRLMDGTGSTIGERGIKFYTRLFQNPSHVAATLNMMANWDLHQLVQDLPFLESTLDMIVGENDKTIPPSDAERLQSMVRHSKVYHLPELGHLAHEENPRAVAQIISRLVRKAG